MLLMKIIKIPISIKIYYLFSLLWLLLSLLWLDFLYWFYWFNYLFILWIIWIFISIIHILFLFKYFNNPIKYTNLNIGFIFFILILYLFSLSYNGFFIIFIFYNLFYLFKFFQFKKFMNLDEWYKKNKYVKYVEKKQYKNIFITYWVIIFSLIIFYFTYYSVSIIEFKQINDSYFENIHKYKDISNKDNWLFALEEYSNHISNLEYIENKELYNIIKEWWKIVDLVFELEKISEIDNLRLWIKNILNKKAIIDNYNDDFVSLQWYSMVSKDSIYNVLYYLEKWDEKKAIDYLIDNYRLWNMLITSYWGIVQFIVWITIQSITLDELNYVLDNYELNNVTLYYLQNSIKNLESKKDSYKNIINYEYNNQLNFINTSEWFIKYDSIVFHDKNYLKEWFKNMYYLGDFENDTIWNLCDKEKRDNNLFKFLTKKNIVSRIQLTIGCIVTQNYNKDLEKIIFEEEKILKKLNLLSKEK